MKKEKCFKCQSLITVKFVLARVDYSKKNNWEYWTEKKENEGKYMCNFCLLDLYYNDKLTYLKEVTNKKKRITFSNYVYTKTIS
jgi:hypothetical protein